MKNYIPKTFPSYIPLFPISGALLLPHSKLPLNIFELRYLEMIEDALRSPFRLIGMIQPRRFIKEKTKIKHNSFHKVGCAGRISSFSETDDGRYLITLVGVSRFEFQEIQEIEKPYVKGKVNWSKFDNDLLEPKKIKNFNRKEFLNTLKKYFDSAQISSDWHVLQDVRDDVLINSLSMLCPFDPDEKQVLLEAETLFHRKKILLTLMELSSEKSQNNEYIH
tara:strand:- start:456 stop:1118 length:663 start_codon:yes stop_codon:yes gene_type:complete